MSDLYSKLVVFWAEQLYFRAVFGAAGEQTASCMVTNL